MTESLIPERVLQDWVLRSEGNLERQAVHHKNHHEYWDRCSRSGEDTMSCWYCQRSRVICKKKLRFDTIEEAQAAADEVNFPGRDRLIIPYCCFWSEGLHFHNHTATGTSQRRKARKRMRKLIMSAIQEDQPAES